MGFVAAGFGVGEDGGEGGPARIGKDPLGVFGNGCAYVVGKSAAGLFTRAPGFKFGERRSERGVGCRLEVLDGLARSVGLVGMALGLVPACSEDGGPDECSGQGCEDAAVGAGGGVCDVAGRGPQGVGGTVLGPDL